MPDFVLDAHRLIGPVPFDDLPRDPRPEMDRLGVHQALVTHTLSLYSDVRAGNEALFDVGDPRLRPVPVLLPEPFEPVPDWDVPMVRLCPARHRFDLTGPTSLRRLAALGTTVAIELDETSPAELIALAGRLPGLRVLLLNPGYRRLRAIGELMAELPDLWLEIGTVNTQHGVEWLAGHVGAERLVFGTGAPVLDDCGPRFLLDHLDLPEADIDLIAAGGSLFAEGGPR
ncbi:Amidohydrolase [Nonomuraea solani]|uniref:Amidohydrolase n=1 Tax=Nonomuraea solani TaxID=1144553 RepID=A0A1H6EHD6_9ACTN|nr:amidohydrolase family protein [Nonomuraea solani]SEG97237.1 Amidohydrolase [Nonomuraea solani]